MRLVRVKRDITSADLFSDLTSDTSNAVEIEAGEWVAIRNSDYAWVRAQHPEITYIYPDAARTAFHVRVEWLDLDSPEFMAREMVEHMPRNDWDAYLGAVSQQVASQVDDYASEVASIYAEVSGCAMAHYMGDSDRQRGQRVKRRKTAVRRALGYTYPER